MKNSISVEDSARRHPCQCRGHRRLQRARCRRVQQRPRRTRTAGRRPIGAQRHSRGHRSPSRLQLHRPRYPEFIGENCVGCMDCVTECPDTAILGKVVEPAMLEEHLRHRPTKGTQRMAAQWAVTNKYYNVLEKKGVGGGKFGIFIDPTKCKGCAECVDACGDHDALKMIRKNDQNMKWYQAGVRLVQVACPKRRPSSSMRRLWRT